MAAQSLLLGDTYHREEIEARGTRKRTSDTFLVNWKKRPKSQLEAERGFTVLHVPLQGGWRVGGILGTTKSIHVQPRTVVTLIKSPQLLGYIRPHDK